MNLKPAREPVLLSIQLCSQKRSKFTARAHLRWLVAIPSRWSYLWSNQVPAHGPVCTRLNSSDPVNSRFWFCLKWTRVRHAFEPILSGRRSQLQPIPISDEVPADAANDSSPRQFLTSQHAAEPGFFAASVPTFLDNPSSLPLNPVTFNHVPVFAVNPSGPQLNLVSFDNVPAFAVDISSWDQPRRPVTWAPSTTVFTRRPLPHKDSSYTIGFLRAIPTLNTAVICSIRDFTLNSSFVNDSLHKGLLSLISSSASVSFV